MISAALLFAGCAQPASPSRGTSSQPTATLDRSKAYLKLEEIEPRPEKTGKSDSVDVEAADAAARRFFNSGNDKYKARLWGEAIEAMQRALRVEPRLAAARVILAKAALRQGNRELARGQIEQAIRQRPDDVAAQRILGEIEWQENNPAEAIAALRRAVGATNATTDNPETILARLTLGLALRKQGYLSAAAEQLQAYLSATDAKPASSAPDDELSETQSLYRGTAAALLGEIQTDLGNKAEAIAAYQRAVLETPSDLKLRERLAHTLADAGRGEESMAVVRQLLADMPSKSDGLELLRAICDELKEPRRFDAEIARLATASQDPALQLQLSGVLVERHRTKEAIHVLERVLESDPGQVDARYRLIGLYLDEGRIDDFIAGLTTAMRRDLGADNRAETLIGKACVTARDKFLVSAQRQESGAIGDAAAHYVLGRALECAGQPAEAAYREASHLDPKFEPAAVRQVQMLLERKDWERAAAAAENAIDHDVRSARLFRLKARAHDALDQLDEAESALTEAYRLSPKSVDVLLAMGDLAKRRRDARKFEQVYSKIIGNVDERCIPAREALIRLYLEANQTPKAQVLFKEFGRLGLHDPAVERCAAAIALATRDVNEEGYRERLLSLAQNASDDVETRLELSRSYGRSRDYESCLKYAAAALTIDPDNIDARDIQVVVLKRLLRFDEAARVMNELLVERPRNLLWRQQTVEIALDKGDYGGAIEQLKSLLKRDDLGALAVVFTDELIRQLSAAERWDEAVDTAKAWLDRQPDDAYRRSIYLRVLSGAKRHDEAIDLASDWQKTEPSNAALRDQLLATLNAAKRYAEAQRRLVEWLADAPDDLALNRALINELWLARDWKGAADVARIGAQSPTHKRDYDQWLGRTFILSGHYDEAIRHFQRAVEAEQSEDNYQSLVLSFIYAERYREAEAVIGKVLAQLQGNASASPVAAREIAADFKGYLASIYERTGRIARAIQYLEEIQQADPTDAGHCNNLGYTMLDANRDIDRAEELIRNAVGIDPRNDAYLDSLGWVHYKRGEFDRAIHYLKLALRQNRWTDPVMLDHLGDAYLRAGRSKDAGKAWKKARTELDELAKDAQPLDVERRNLRKRVIGKLDELKSGKTTSAAPLGKRRTTSRPAA